ncbi:MAG: hypothetical protein KGL39_02750 [Patescibacteria group bacterium]|nr:hypothetical protein [Patescibacteria group bacterium]
MDLIPQKGAVDCHYNWSGWSWLITHLQEWGVDTNHFDGVNDGKLIPAAKCCEVAAAIEAHLPELDAEDREWLEPHVAIWRASGGFRQC